MFPIPPEPEEVGIIEGHQADSKEEWWVAQALWKYEIPFQYQFQIFGGTSRRGGLIVDFVVYAPMAIPFEVNGNYWHKDEMDGGDKMDLIAIEQYFNKEAIVLWGSDAVDRDAVFAFVRKYVAN